MSYDDGQHRSTASKYRRRISEIFRARKSGSPGISPTAIQPSMFNSPGSPRMEEGERRTSKTARMEDLPPWERVELPVFQVDGQRYGGAAANAQPKDTWGDWKGFGGKKRPSTASSTFSSSTLIPMVSPRAGSYSSGKEFPGFKIDKPSTLSPHMEQIAGTPRMTPEYEQPPGQSPLMGSSEQQQRRLSSELSGSMSSSQTVGAHEGARLHHSDDDQSTPGTSSTRFPQTPGELRTFDPEIRRGSALSEGSDVGGKQFALPTIRKGSAVSGTGSNEVYDAERGNDDEDDDLDLMRVLQKTAPPDTFNDGFGVRSGSEQFDYMPESMSSYLNRKTALLMLWFPLGVSDLCGVIENLLG